jgi:hypothetical protein
VSRPGRCRWLALSLLGAVVVARPAAASGCHAPDRPVLGLSVSWDAPRVGAVTTAPTAAKLGRLPCSKHIPGAPQAAQADISPGLAGPAELRFASPTLPLLPRLDEPLHPRHVSAVRPRPPRIAVPLG